MKLTVLGSGSCMVVQGGRTPSAYLLEVQDTVLMIDTGTGSTRNLPKIGTSVEELDAVVNTHRHPDHVSDLIPLVQDKIVRSGSRDEQDIQLYGPEGHTNYVDTRLREEVPIGLDQFEDEFGFGLDILEIDQVSEVEGIALDSIEADHGPEDFRCLSLRFEAEGKEVVFTGDTDYHEGLIDFAEGADLLITDCSKPHEMKSEGHMTGKESGELARKADVETLLLSHLYPEADEHGVREEAEEEFSGEVLVAEDLMELIM